MQRFILFCLPLALAASAASANGIANPGFETFTGSFGGDGGAQLPAGSTALTGWSVINGEIAILRAPNAYNLGASEGIYFLDLAGYGNAGFPKGLTQTLGGLTPGQDYALRLDIGIRPCVSGASNCAGPVQVGVSVGALSEVFTHDADLPGDVWGTYRWVFTAGSASPALTLLGLSLPAGGQYIGLDNLSLTAVPLPAAAGLLAAGLAGLLAAGRGRGFFAREAGRS